jgi:hypothetical protein
VNLLSRQDSSRCRQKNFCKKFLFLKLTDREMIDQSEMREHHLLFESMTHFRHKNLSKRVRKTSYFELQSTLHECVP